MAVPAFAQAPYAGTILPAPDVGAIPPPIPGDPVSFSYNAQLGLRPWAGFSWAGGYPLPTYPGGGVLAHPDSELGVMRVSAWWPDATVLQLVRIDLADTRTPVRTSYPLLVPEATRRNYCSNPSVEVGLNGYIADAGTPTLSQLADTAAPSGSYVLRATNAGAGSNGVIVPTVLTVPASGRPVTVGFGLRLSATPSSLTISIGWTDAGGGGLTANTWALTASDVATCVQQFNRPVIIFTAPSGAVTPTLRITAAGMPAGGTVDLDAITFEVGSTSGAAFDGRTLGGAWIGTAELSASVLSPVQTILDGECPLDTIVSYQLQSPGITGGRVVSDPAYLDSAHQTWLTHPASSTTPTLVELAGPPVLEHSIDQGVFWPLSGKYPLIVTDAMRHAPEGTVDFVWQSFAERDVLKALFIDGSPVLLRSPGDYGYEPTFWLALKAITEDRQDRKAWHDTGILSAEFHQVGRPEDV